MLIRGRPSVHKCKLLRLQNKLGRFDLSVRRLSTASRTHSSCPNRNFGSCKDLLAKEIIEKMFRFFKHMLLNGIISKIYQNYILINFKKGYPNYRTKLFQNFKVWLFFPQLLCVLKKCSMSFS
jgi:hypothetical protein